MTEFQTLSRFIKLNRQALKLLDADHRGKRAEILRRIEDAQNRAVLLRMAVRIESKMGNGFDSELSRQLDCVNYLIESQETGS